MCLLASDVQEKGENLILHNFFNSPYGKYKKVKIRPNSPYMIIKKHEMQTALFSLVLQGNSWNLVYQLQLWSNIRH